MEALSVKNMKRRRGIAAIFLLASMLSIVVAIPAVMNYAELYRVVEDFTFTLSAITIDRMTVKETGTAYVAVTFNATNPTRFMGLNVVGVNCILSYLKGEDLIDLPGKNQPLNPGVAVDAFRGVAIQINFTFTYIGEQQYESNVRYLISLLQGDQKEVSWIVRGQYTLSAYSYMFPGNINPVSYTTNLE